VAKATTTNDPLRKWLMPLQTL